MNKKMLAFSAGVLPKVKNAIKRYPLFCDLRRLLIRRQDYWQRVLIGKHLSMELTNRCNLDCRYCPRCVMLKVRKIGDMDPSLFKKMVDQAAALNLEAASVVGYGEPLMYPHFLESIRYLRQKMPTVEILLSTNGTLLSERVAHEIGKCEADQVVLSLNLASREKYEGHQRSRHVRPSRPEHQELLVHSQPPWSQTKDSRPRANHERATRAKRG